MLGQHSLSVFNMFNTFQRIWGYRISKNLLESAKSKHKLSEELSITATCAACWKEKASLENEQLSVLIKVQRSQDTHLWAKVKVDATYDEIRAGYKAAILNSHPDKLLMKPKASQLDHELQERFLFVQKAWEVLSDPTSRANYDVKLQSSRQKLEDFADEVRLEEMTVETASDMKEFSYQCRCGDYFSVTSSELNEMGLSLDKKGKDISQSATDSSPASVLLPCGSCSLKILLVMDPAS
ncbi:hypothetical protein J5N97_018814 [Dioscorea zingiberensis]|uniref:Uncharacterized protein n=1 Tax=Dioscorea zingiberensis TaxID=325984 RepID=A0A9D5CEN9_9LILI|nr:hypothetical protein J5N97_018814 [Dioscorea zingiberensis]